MFILLDTPFYTNFRYKMGLPNLSVGQPLANMISFEIPTTSSYTP